MTETLVCGLDVGITTTDAVATWDPESAVHLETRRTERPAEEAIHRLLEASRPPAGEIVIGATGVGAGALPATIAGFPVVRVGEHRAIGIGGTRLANRADALVVSVGTGTALVSVHGEEVEPVFPGTGVGGGMVVGLARALLGEEDFAAIAALASRGDRARVDFTIGEVVGGPLGALPSSATASHLAKASRDSAPADLAASIANLVAEVAITVSLLGLRATDQPVAVLIGRILSFAPFAERITAVADALGGSLVVAPRAASATAWGAAWSARATLERGRA